MNQREVSLAVIGAGPAGLAAAAQAAKLGVETVVLDLHAQSGGHFFSLPPEQLQPSPAEKAAAEGKSLIEIAKKAGAEILNGAEVWGIYKEDRFHICISGVEPQEIFAKKVILAPGAIERSLPFPGWTLPGVITAGGALRLIKHQQMLPGRKVLISGSGPLQLSLAAHLAAHDCEIVALLELQSRSALLQTWKEIPQALTQFARVQEGLGYLGALRTKKIPYQFGSTVIRALGEQAVSGAVIAKLDQHGKPLAGSEKTIAVDCICLGYGLLPETQLSRLLECKQTIHPLLGTWVPVRDTWLETSIPGVFVVGDGADITGKPAAILEGKIAALAAASQLEMIDDSKARLYAAPLQRKLKSEQRFAHYLQAAFPPPTDPAFLAQPDTTICRCECISYQQILEAIQDGATTVQAVKYHSRAGMGWCRGTTCAPIISQIIARQRNLDLDHTSRASTRPPIFPVVIEEILEQEVTS